MLGGGLFASLARSLREMIVCLEPWWDSYSACVPQPVPQERID